VVIFIIEHNYYIEIQMFPEAKKMPQFGFGEGIGIIVWRTWYPALIHGHHNYATTYDFPVRIKFIDDWRAPEEKKEEWIGWNIPEYIKTAKELETEGVAAICTNCGLTGTMQEELANAVDIPVFTSSLMQVPFAARSLKKGKKVGIMVASAQRARAQDYKMLRSCGIDESVPHVLFGMDESDNVDTWRTQFRPGSGYDPKKVEGALVEHVLKMVSENPEIGAIVLECTEMPLYAAAVREATGLLVFDSSTMIRYVYHAIVKKHYF
jgi:Asp/Glu/hydantoin racemase